MVAKVQILRTETPNKPPTGLLPGELSVEMATDPIHLWVGVPTTIDATGMKKLLPTAGGVTIADAPPATPVAGDLWWESDSGFLWLWYVDVDGGQWVQAAGSVGDAGVTVADAPPASPGQGDLWWESDTAILWIWYDDGSGGQWVQAAGSGGGGTVDAYTKAESDAKYVELAGDTMSGSLIIDTASGGNFILNDTGAGGNWIQGQKNGLLHWQIGVGNNQAGSEFCVARSDDAGVAIDYPLSISRATGDTTLNGNLTINKATWPGILISKSDDTSGATINGQKLGVNQWIVQFGNATPASDFLIERVTDGGQQITALSINRASGELSMTTGIVAPTSPALIKLGPVGLNQSSIACRPDADNTTTMAIEAVAGTVVGSIFQTPTGVTFNTTSDAELKEDLKSFDAGNIIDDTNVYDFAWKSTGERAYGVIAQEANEVYPQAVTHSLTPDHGEWWGIDYSKYVPVLIQAIKELRQEVAELKAAAAGPIIDPQRRG